MNAPFLIPISKTADGDEETASLTAENKQMASHFNNYFKNKKVKAAEEGRTRALFVCHTQQVLFK